MMNKSVTMLAADVITPAGHEYESREQPRNREHHHRDQPGKGKEVTRKTINKPNATSNHV